MAKHKLEPHTANSTIIPPMGLGTFRLKGQKVLDAVSTALQLGYRHVDTAQLYENEGEVGQAIRESGFDREELFVTTKVWYENLQKDKLIQSLKGSLRRLDLEYVDLALVHWPSPNNEVPMAEYIGALNQAREEGLTKHIGVSNFTIAQIDEALSVPGGEHLITNQIEVHPFLANKEVTAHCQNKGLQVTGYMPLAVGKVLEDTAIKGIALSNDIPPAQVALAWALQRGIAVIPASANPKHQKDNLGALKVKLTVEELARIDALDVDERIANPPFAPDWDN